MKDQDQIFKRIIELQCSINFEEIQRILKLSEPGQARRLRARLLSTNILPNLSPLQKRMDPVDTFQYLVEISEVSCFPDVSFWQADQQFEQVYWRQKFLEGHQLPRCPEFKLGPPVTTNGGCTISIIHWIASWTNYIPQTTNNFASMGVKGFLEKSQNGPPFKRQSLEESLRSKLT